MYISQTKKLTQKKIIVDHVRHGSTMGKKGKNKSVMMPSDGDIPDNSSSGRDAEDKSVNVNTSAKKKVAKQMDC